jgi:hypothetical protein
MKIKQPVKLYSLLVSPVYYGKNRAIYESGKILASDIADAQKTGKVAFNIPCPLKDIMAVEV